MIPLIKFIIQRNCSAFSYIIPHWETKVKTILCILQVFCFVYYIYVSQEKMFARK